MQHTIRHGGNIELTLLMTSVLRRRPTYPRLRLKLLMQVKSFGYECIIKDKLEVNLVKTKTIFLRIF